MTESRIKSASGGRLHGAVRLATLCVTVVACSSSPRPGPDEHQTATEELAAGTSALSKACTAKILDISPAPRQQVLGGGVTVRGAGTCMAGVTPEFRFSVQVSGTTRLLCDWQTQSSCSWDTSTLPGPDYYKIVLETRRIGQVSADGAVSRAYAIGAVCTDVALVATPGSGTSIELGATGSCDAGVTPLYRFDMRSPGGRWVTIAPFGASSSATWDAAGAPPGRAQFRVSIARADHALADASRTIAYDLGAACTASSLAVARVTGIRQVTANASCGDGVTPEYRFSVEAPDGSVSTLRDWAAAPSTAWDTSVLAGKYRVNADVRAIENVSQTASRRSLVVAAGTQCSVNLNVPVGVLPTDLPVPFSATTTCPSPEFAFSVRPATDPRFVPVCGFAAADACTWQPPVGALAGQYYVRVYVRHSGGNLMQAAALVDFSLGGSARCISNDQCPSEEVCVGGSPTRVCIEPTLRCVEGQPCPAGTYCDAGTCSAAAVAGEPCSPGGRCAPGAYCSADGACRPSIERFGSCSPDYPPEQCVAGTACRLDDQAKLSCLAPGDAFICTSDADCRPDSFCGFGSTCRPFLSLGQTPCYSATTPGLLQCGTGLYCRKDGSPGGVCAALPGAGAACQTATGRLGTSAACAPGTACVARVCRLLSNYGEDCSKVACASGLACVTGASNGACFVGGESCAPGYVPNGTECVDLDECATQRDDCAVQATCTNTPGGFSCACKPGYAGDGKTCVDVDECSTGTDNCGAHATCVNTEGSFKCECGPGYAYAGDGVSCTDVDECRLHRDNCGPLAFCTNTDGGYTCTCGSGYRGDGLTCTDIDECAEQLVDCGAHASCSNTVGGYACLCEPGYSHPWLGDHYGPNCTCTSPTFDCGGRCVDLANDAANCGACGVSCPSGQACVAGGCGSRPRFLDMDAGDDFTCAVRDSGQVVCWGFDVLGQVRAPAGTFSSVSAGGNVACALTAQGTVSCWGDKRYAPPAATFLAVSAGYMASCGIRSDQTLACWGTNDWGETSAPSGTFSALSLVGDVGCGIRSDGTLACWGYNLDGQASPPAGVFSAVSAGSLVSCGVRANGQLACWGSSGSSLATPPAGTFTSVSVSFRHACALRTDQTVACWGDNTDGAAQPPAGTFLKVSVGGHHTSADGEHSCGLRTDGSIVCWGDNRWGESSPP
jgi:hypothetical protein